MKLILKSVNHYIHKKYPLVSIAEDDHGGLYLYSDDDKTGLALAGLYSSGLDMHINSIKSNAVDGDALMQAVERVMSDWARYESDRMPVTFDYYIERSADDEITVLDKASSFEEAQSMVVDFGIQSLRWAISGNRSSALMIKCNNNILKSISVKVNR